MGKILCSVMCTSKCAVWGRGFSFVISDGGGTSGTTTLKSPEIMVHYAWGRLEKQADGGKAS